MENRVSIREILRFTGADVDSLSFIEGEEMYHSNQIVLCCLSGVKLPEYNIVALSIQSGNGLDDYSHVFNEIRGTLCRENNELVVKSLLCTCKGGAGETCKHCVAVLLYCNNSDITTFNTISPTDVKCKWKLQEKNIKSKFEVMPCHVKPIIELPYTKEEKMQNRKILTAACSISSVSPNQKRKSGSDITSFNTISRTHLKYKWKSLKRNVKSKFQDMPIRNYTCCVKPIKELTCTEEEMNRNREILLAACPNSSASMSRNRKRKSLGCV